MRLGTFYLSVINYPWGPPYQPNTPICTQFAIQYFDNMNNSWHFTDWTGIADPVAITCDLDAIALIAYVGNADPNAPYNPMTFPTDGSTINVTGSSAPIPHTVDNGGHYRLNLNARTGQSGVIVFEGGDWVPGEPPGGNKSLVPWVVGGILVGAAIAVVLKRR